MENECSCEMEKKSVALPCVCAFPCFLLTSYFPVESTQEMLDEWRPLLCPFDESMNKGIAYLDLFLPTLLPPEQHQFGFKSVAFQLIKCDQIPVLTMK